MRISFRPNLLGRHFGRKVGVLYDDYVNCVSGSACAINKMEKEEMLHTQEVTGSSPVAPTISFQKFAHVAFPPKQRLWAEILGIM
jgi:hypothetical protein